MKLIGIVGSNSDESYNRKLMTFLADHIDQSVDFEMLDTKDIPLFNQDHADQTPAQVAYISKKITGANGVIIATPEQNHTVPANLKSLIEWLSYKAHPFENKPILIVGASYYNQGSSRSQLHLRQILEAPGVNGIVMPSDEFLLANAKEAFDENGHLKDDRTAKFLLSTVDKFKRFVVAINGYAQASTSYKDEDLNATGEIDTTIKGVDKHSKNWVEEAADQAHAVSGNTYVKLDRGVLTVDQLNAFFASMPAELTYADANNQFLYYNHSRKTDHMFAGRRPEQVGNPLADCHPPKAIEHVKQVIHALRTGESDVIRIHVPKHGPGKFVVHTYQAMHDPDGNYLGVNEYVKDIQPMIDWYLKQTGQTLTGGSDAISSASVQDEAPEVDTTTSASISESEPDEVDTVTSASIDQSTPEPDATTSASISEAVEDEDDQPDSVSSASLKD